MRDGDPPLGSENKGFFVTENISYYSYPIFLQEVRDLRWDRGKRRVDHRPNGSKDVSDGVAGAVMSVLKDEGSYRLPSQLPSVMTATPAVEADPRNNFSWVLGRYSRNVKPASGEFTRRASLIFGR
jgi:hypothetical protein